MGCAWHVALFRVQFGTWRSRDASYGVVFHGGIIELACRSLDAVLGSDGACHIAATGTGVRIIQDEYLNDVDGE